jgi:tetratricopeptide (TPR) repeat protein
MRRRVPRAAIVAVVILMGTSAASSRADSPTKTLDRAHAALAAGQPAAAESLANAATTALGRERRPDSLAIARGWSIAARSRIERGAPIDSIVASQAAAAAQQISRRITPPNADVAFAMETAGLAATRRNATPAATAWLERTVAVRRALGADPDTALASTLRRLGALENTRATVDSARAHLEEALAIRERADTAASFEKARLHRALADLATDRHDFRVSERHLDAAVSQAERAGGPMTTELIPILQTRVYEMGQSDQASLAMPYMQRAYEIGRAAWGEDDDRTLALRAAVASRYILLGDPLRGRTELLDIERRMAARPKPDTLKLAGVRYGLAGTYFTMRDTANALPWLERAARGYESLGRIHDPQYLYAQYEFALAFRDKDDYARAESVLVRALAIDRERPGSPDALTGTLTGGFCSVLFIEQRYTAVDSLADSLARRFDRAGARRTVAVAHAEHWKYWAQLALGHPGEAFHWAARNSATERTVTTRIVRGMSERAAFGFEKDRAEPLDWLLGLSEQLGGGTSTTAWDELIRWRGLVRHELGRRHLASSPGSDSTLDALRTRWVRAQEELARGEVGSRAGASETLQRNAEDARRDYVTAAAGRLSLLPDDSLSVDLVAGALKPGQALVAYYEVAPASDTAKVGVFVWRAGDAAPHQRALGSSADLAALTTTWNQALEAPATGGAADAAAERSARSAGEKVKTAVWYPIAVWVGDAREVYVVTAGPVQDLHWTALPWGSHDYWAEKGPVMRVLNAERELLAPPLTPAPGGLLAFGGINYAGGAQAAGSTLVAARFRAARSDCRDGTPPVFEPLPATAEEVKAVAAEWPPSAGDARVVSGPEATETALKQLAHGYRSLHLATHGYVPRDTCASDNGDMRGIGSVTALSSGDRATAKPAAAHGASATAAKPATPAAAAPKPASGPSAADSNSVVWLAFAGANRAAERESGADDGLLTPEEVVTLDLSGTGWVVLSSCYATAGREDWAREGLSGMRRAFHMAGARTVIGSSWPVPDRATAEWMTALYAARGAGAGSPGAAIQRASAAVLAARRRARRGTHPFYWASFTATGE